jgi:hypothetical protein
MIHFSGKNSMLIQVNCQFQWEIMLKTYFFTNILKFQHAEGNEKGHK